MTSASKIPEKIIGALLSAESFIAAELQVRQSSCLPDPAPDEAEDIAEAEEVLALVRGAMAECEVAA